MTCGLYGIPSKKIIMSPSDAEVRHCAFCYSDMYEMEGTVVKVKCHMTVLLILLGWI